jgi:hypothetical protein
MPEVLLLALPVAIGVAIAAAAVLVLQRTGLVAAESRKAAAARRTVSDLGIRVEEVLGPVSKQIDLARHGQIEAAALGDDVATASQATEELVEAGRALDVPAALGDVKAGIVAELERAQRALDMVEHGRSIMTGARVRGRELEAQTSVKRGYLNLLHAREAIVEHVARAAAYRSPIEARRDARRGF